MLDSSPREEFNSGNGKTEDSHDGPRESNRDFLINEYGDILTEKVEAVLYKVRSESRALLDYEIVQNVGEIKVSPSGDKLIIEHDVFDTTQGKIILPNSQCLSDTSITSESFYKAFEYEEGRLPFTIVSSLELNNNGIPEVEHRIKLTELGLQEVFRNFIDKFKTADSDNQDTSMEPWVNIPRVGNFSYLNLEIENYLDSVLKESIANETASAGDLDFSDLNEKQQIESLKLGNQRYQVYKPETNDSFLLGLLSEYYHYYILDGVRLNSETSTITIQIETPKQINITDSNNLILSHALTQRVDSSPRVDSKNIPNLPHGMEFMRNIEWETLNLEISLEYGFLNIKKLD